MPLLDKYQEEPTFYEWKLLEVWEYIRKTGCFIFEAREKFRKDFETYEAFRFYD